MTNLAQPPKQSYKAFLWDYDYLLAQSDDECCYSLSYREIQILLAQIDFIAWKTRYKPTETEIDIALLEKWRGNLARKLMSGCCPDEGKIYRFNSDGELESSVDGGTTWIPAPEDDPRLTAPQFVPLPGEDGNEKKCTAANNATGHIQAKADQLIADAALWSNITLLIAAIQALLVFLSIFASGGILTPLVVGLVGAIMVVGQEAFEAAMTAAVYETFNCILYCNMNSDGTFSEAQIEAIKAEIETELTGIAATYLRDNVGLLGAIGLSNMAATPQSTFFYDCEGCDCELPCSEKYEIFDQPGYPGSFGTIVATTDSTIDVEISGTGYGILQAINIADCCYVGGLEVISGEAYGVAFVACPNPFVGVWTEATPVGQCCSFIQCQGVPGSVIRIILGPCA